MKIVSELDFAFYKTQSKNWKPQGQLSDVWLEDEQSSYAPIEVELMQFTGLYDKNGREIYEGDIVQEGTKRLVVYWNVLGSGHWWFGKPCKDVKYEAAKKVSINDLEVIGNIFENPELLDGDGK